MTVSESVIKWLYGFNSAEFWNMQNIDTDIQSSKVDSFSLVKEPVQNVRTYISGRKEITEHYMIRARLSSSVDADRIDNLDFGEALEKWIRKQNALEKYPKIAKVAVKSIETTTPFYLGVTEDNNSIYQMTIAIKFERGEE